MILFADFIDLVYHFLRITAVRKVRIRRLKIIIGIQNTLIQIIGTQEILPFLKRRVGVRPHKPLQGYDVDWFAVKARFGRYAGGFLLDGQVLQPHDYHRTAHQKQHQRDDGRNQQMSAQADVLPGIVAAVFSRRRLCVAGNGIRFRLINVFSADIRQSQEQFLSIHTKTPSFSR